jgi:hypothetical protein
MRGVFPAEVGSIFATRANRRLCSKMNSVRGLMTFSLDIPPSLGRARRLVALVLAACAVLAPGFARAEQSWGYVVGWFHPATYADHQSCPDGLEPLSHGLHRRILASLGYGAKEVDKLMAGPAEEYFKVLSTRGRVNGKPVDPYSNPESVLDPRIKTVKGSKIYGFDLDGRTTEEDFQDPESGTLGVDNQLFRAIGCIPDYHYNLPERPFFDYSNWKNFAAASMPAWLMSISAPDLSRDGQVTVRFLKATYHLEYGANGEPLPDMTYLVHDKHRPQNTNTFKGEIKDGVLTIGSADLYLEGETPMLAQLDLEKVQARFRISPRGELQGYIGGYQPWLDVYFMYASMGIIAESGNGIDVVGVYYALKRLADAGRDPNSGQNLKISATYRLEATPAYLATRAGQVVAVPGRARTQQPAAGLAASGR